MKVCLLNEHEAEALEGGTLPNCRGHRHIRQVDAVALLKAAGSRSADDVNRIREVLPPGGMWARPAVCYPGPSRMLRPTPTRDDSNGGWRAPKFKTWQLV